MLLQVELMEATGWDMLLVMAVMPRWWLRRVLCLRCLVSGLIMDWPGAHFTGTRLVSGLARATLCMADMPCDDIAGVALSMSSQSNLTHGDPTLFGNTPIPCAYAHVTCPLATDCDRSPYFRPSVVLGEPSLRL